MEVRRMISYRLKTLYKFTCSLLKSQMLPVLKGFNATKAKKTHQIQEIKNYVKVHLCVKVI